MKNFQTENEEEFATVREYRQTHGTLEDFRGKIAEISVYVKDNKIFFNPESSESARSLKDRLDFKILFTGPQKIDFEEDHTDGQTRIFNIKKMV